MGISGLHFPAFFFGSNLIGRNILDNHIQNDPDISIINLVL